MAGVPKVFRRFVRDKDGATAVEAAMVMPLVLMSIFGMIHVGIFFFSTHQAQRASEEVGRDIRMLDQPSQEDIAAALNTRLEAPIGGTYRSIVTTIDEHGGTFADIRVAYEYRLPIPFLDRHTFKSESGTRVLLRDLS